MAYIEDSDDTRNTPARTVISLLKSRNAQVKIHDPYITELDGLSVKQDFWEVVNQSNCLVFMTKHSEYYDIDLEKLIKVMKLPIIVDGRNIFDQKQVENLGFSYKGVGKG